VKDNTTGHPDKKINKENKEFNIIEQTDLQTSTKYFIQQLHNTHWSQQPIELSPK
jgi:hypothetical protein